MKKLGIIVVLVCGMLAIMAGSAFAYGGPHVAFTATNNDGCAGCHVTHAAKGAKLLTANTQTDFCFLCHAGSGSSLNALEGTNTGTGNYVTAGGFNLEDQKNEAGVITVPGHTSVHTMGSNVSIPGGGAGITGGFQCGSCHNPHGSDNARILKTVVNGVTTAPVTMTVTNNTVVSYDGGINQWCAACHTRFNAAVNAGHDKTNDALGMYRHAMGVSAVLPTGANGNIVTGTPLEANKVACLTCHRAHGTKAKMVGSYSNGSLGGLYRDNGTGFEKGVVGSALLRLNDRGVCFNCHNGATDNLPK